MSKLIGLLFIVVVSLFNISCSTAIDDYDVSKKPFDIKEYFNGSIVAWGMVQDYSNKVNRRFCV